MRISNINTRNGFWAVFTLLFILSIVDFGFARMDTELSNWFWGYLFAVNIFLVVMVYLYVGRPIFTFNAEKEVVVIKSGFSVLASFEKRAKVNKKNIVDFNIEESLLKKRLKLKILKKSGVKSISFPITFLSKKKTSQLKNVLNDLLGRSSDQENVHMFI
ncbi:MAG: hypothetical protein SchgKO_03070 [Schleiferiaceae bacterium]|jgi:hypothetical protein